MDLNTRRKVCLLYLEKGQLLNLSRHGWQNHLRVCPDTLSGHLLQGQLNRNSILVENVRPLGSYVDHRDARPQHFPAFLSFPQKPFSEKLLLFVLASSPLFFICFQSHPPSVPLLTTQLKVSIPTITMARWWHPLPHVLACNSPRKPFPTPEKWKSQLFSGDQPSSFGPREVYS